MVVLMVRALTRSFAMQAPLAGAYDEAGLWYSYKHFPGIGKTDVDLHADTSIVPVSKETLLFERTQRYL